MDDKNGIEQVLKEINQKLKVLVEKGIHADILTSIEDAIKGLDGKFGHTTSFPIENKERYNLLTEALPEAISIQTNDKFLYVNKAWEKLFGYSFEELKKKNFTSLVHSESLDVAFYHLLKNEFGNRDARKANIKIIIKNKQEKWFDFSVVDVEYENQKATLAIANDISDILKLQGRLSRSNANMSSLIENTDARIWSVDKDLKIIVANSNYRKAYHKAFNFRLIDGAYCLENTPKAIREEWEKRYKRALSGEQFNLIDNYHIENVSRYTETYFNPIKIGNQIVGVSSISRDISEQMEYQNAIGESEERFKTLVSNIPSVTYRCAMDVSWTMSFISNEVLKLTGYPVSDFINNSVRTFASIIHPDDLSHVDLAVKSGLEEKGSFEMEYRIFHIDGSIRWVYERGRAQYDEKGKVAWLDGVISDVTKQKQTEEALYESEEKYRSIFNSINDIYIRTNINGEIELVSPSVYEHFGYEPEEVTGISIKNLYEKPEAREELIKQLMKNGNVKDFEIILISKSGKSKTTSVNAHLIKDSDGNPIGIEGMARDISLRKLVEQSLRERTKELNSIFDNIPVLLMLVDTNGRVININRTGQNTLSRDTQTTISQLGIQALECIQTITHPKGCGKHDCANCTIRNIVKETFEKRENQYKVEGSLIVNVDTTVKTKYFYISTTYIESEDEDRVLISLDDITDIKEAQEQIRKLSAAVEQSNATIVITDTEGNIQYTNPQFEKSTGYSFKEVYGKNPRILRSSNTSSAEYRDLWKTILNGKTWRGEFLNVKKNGSEYWETAIISPVFDERGKILSFIAIKEDITESKKIQEELVRSEKELRQMDEEKNKFFSILAHDLRGLVGSYHAYSDLLLSHMDNLDKEELLEMLPNLVRSSKDSLNLLDNLLEWGRTSMGKVVLRQENVHLYDLVEDVIGLLNKIALSKEITLANNSDKETIIFADSNVLQTILRNLINNSIKFTPKGGKITVSSVNNKNYIEVSVTDTGIGMDKETMNKLFKLGSKVIREGTEKERGTGLGLIICEDMVNKLGGTIHVESNPGKGSRFYFRLEQVDL